MNELKNWDNYSSEEEVEEPVKKENNKIEEIDDKPFYNDKKIIYLDRYLPLVENAFDVIIL